jgi:plastocyanin
VAGGSRGATSTLVALAALALAPAPLACGRRPTAEGVAAAAASAPPAPADADGGGQAAPAAPAPAGARLGFDEHLLSSVACPGCIVGQILDDEGRPQKDAVVYVKSGLRPGKAVPPNRPSVVDQRDKAFSPHVLAVPVGTKVTFKNSDVVLHNVYSRSPVKTVDLGAFGQDQSRQTTFDEPGRVDVFCAIHTNMHAIILVLDSGFFATTDERGYYEIRGLPPGEYGLRVWSERRQEIDARVEVAAGRPAVLRTKLP